MTTSWISRNRALFYGLGIGLVLVGGFQLALLPQLWFPKHLRQVIVAGNCGYSQLAVKMLSEIAAHDFVALPVPANEHEFEAHVCHQTLTRLKHEGTVWLYLVPESLACKRLLQYTARKFEVTTPAEGYPTWLSGSGDYLGVGMDPNQIAKLHLDPPPFLVASWIEGGFDRERIKELGFTLP